MKPQLTVLPGSEPDDIDLDLLELGVGLTLEERSRIESARRGPLAQADADLMEARARFDAGARPLRRQARRPPWPLLAAGGLALAAAALATVGLSGLGDPGVRPMGGVEAPVSALDVDLQVLRGGQPASGGDFRADDELLVTLESPRDGFLDVWTRQEDGGLSLLVFGRPVRQGEPMSLPGAIRLDPYAGKEWLMMRVTDEPSAPAAFADLAPADLEPTTSWSLEVTRAP
ncbi:MAG: hypothetical protein AAF602_06955 [Myxococcota bacterium]